jgi:serine/threonine protein kinase
MDDPAFNQVSSEAKDFIRKLLIPQTTSRMTVHEALDHPWLAHLSRQDGEMTQIPSQRYKGVRDAVRERYVSILLVNLGSKF